MKQLELFETDNFTWPLPVDYTPFRPDYLDVARIYLTRGSTATPERRRFVERICSLYPDIPVIDKTAIPHNQVEFTETDELSLHEAGKRTLVFGELKTAVRFSNEEGNTCPNYWHVSPYGFCPHDCKYCYLAGTHGVRFSPSIKIYVNVPEMLENIRKTAKQFRKPTAFYVGKLQDGLALDPLTAYSTIMVPFFAKHPIARMTLLTKSAHIENLLDLEHNGHTILSWSINPPEVSAAFESNLPSVDERLDVMCRVAEKGYPIRANMMPLIPIDGWKDIYTDFTRRLVREVPIRRLTLGGICIYSGARMLMEMKLGHDNAISRNITGWEMKGEDGRGRYSESMRKQLYSCVIEAVRNTRPSLELALCLEEDPLWEKTGLVKNMGRCNCVL